MKLNRKKTLITSLVVMILCMVLLAGSTYAAFNEVNTAKVTIGTGSFDMVVMASAASDDVVADSAITKAVSGTDANTATLVAELTMDGWNDKYVYFKVTNNGAIAFDLAVAGARAETGEGTSTTDVLNYELVQQDALAAPNANLSADTASASKANMAASASTYICLHLSCENLTGGVTYKTVTITITFTATQV